MNLTLNNYRDIVKIMMVEKRKAKKIDMRKN